MRKTIGKFALLLLALCWPLLLAASDSGAHSLRLRAAIDELLAVKATPDTAANLHQAAINLRQLSGLEQKPLQDPVIWPALTDDTAPRSLAFVDLRIILGQLANQTGANGHLSLVQAQPRYPSKVLVLRGGPWRLSQLETALRNKSPQDLTQKNSRWILTRPLVIWTGASLQLHPGERLSLSTENGVFLLNFGSLIIQSALITSTEQVNPRAAGFRPFLLTAGGGRLQAETSEFRGLGMAHAPGFNGVSLLDSAVFQPTVPHRLRGNLFTQGTALRLSLTRDSYLSENQFLNARETALYLDQTRATQVTGNRFQATFSGPAIRITAGSENTVVRGNYLLDGAAAGIRVDRGSIETRISGNLIAGNRGPGLAISHSSCNQVSGNILAANDGEGLSLQTSLSTLIRKNAILFNGGPGLFLRAQPTAAQTLVQSNLISGNQSGIKGAGHGDLHLRDNNLSAQLPRVFAGDLMLAPPGHAAASTRSPLPPCLLTGESG